MSGESLAASEKIGAGKLSVLESDDPIVVFSGTYRITQTYMKDVTFWVGGGKIPGTLELNSSIIGHNSRIDVFDGIPVVIHDNFGIVRSVGWNVNLGTMAVTASYSHPMMLLQIADGPASPGSGSVNGTFLNAGTINVTVGSRLTVAAQSPTARLVNSGLMDVEGRAWLDTDVIGIGEIRLGPPGTLNGMPEPNAITFARGVGAGQVIAFDGGGDLQIEELADFHGLIRGFGPDHPRTADAEQERIDLIGLDVTDIDYRSFGRTGVLTLEHDGTRLGALRFAGRYTEESFALTRTETGTTIEFRSA